MKDKLLLKKAKERLDEVYFWLAVLRNFDEFTKLQKEKIDKAYHLINEIYEPSKPKPKPEKPYNANEIGIF